MRLAVYRKMKTPDAFEINFEPSRR